MKHKAIAFFCEDVRDEIGDKSSFMGVLGNTLFVPGFPGTMTRLFVVIMVQSSDWPVSLKISIRQDGKEFLSFDGTMRQKKKNRRPPVEEGLSGSIQVGLPPLSFEQPGHLEVFADFISSQKGKKSGKGKPSRIGFLDIALMEDFAETGMVPEKSAGRSRTDA